jgi:hypothetical protein
MADMDEDLASNVNALLGDTILTGAAVGLDTLGPEEPMELVLEETGKSILGTSINSVFTDDFPRFLVRVDKNSKSESFQLSQFAKLGKREDQEVDSSFYDNYSQISQFLKYICDI